MITIEIWSDVVCPFCYIGKRRLEKALAQFPHRDEVTIEWKSFLLDPDTETQVGLTINEYLAARKGWTVDYTREMNKYVTDMAAGEGLQYDFDRVVVANSVQAHRILQLAKRYHKGDAVKEALFSAYFEQGKNIDDAAVLTEIGLSVGLPEDMLTDVLQNEDMFRKQVFADAQEAGVVGARGVPFFVFNRAYAISGAQPVEAFLSVLEKVHAESLQKVVIPVQEGDTCTPEGNC